MHSRSYCSVILEEVPSSKEDTSSSMTEQYIFELYLKSAGCDPGERRQKEQRLDRAVRSRSTTVVL